MIDVGATEIFGLYVFLYFAFALPIVRASWLGRLPATGKYEVAAALITIGHAWMVCLMGVVTFMEGDRHGSGVVNYKRLDMINDISLAYFIFDLMYITIRDEWRVFLNKYFYHHIAAIAFLGMCNMAMCYHVGYELVWWLVYIEASNVFLKIWEISKRNRPITEGIYRAVEPLFLWTCIPWRIYSITVGTFAIFVKIVESDGDATVVDKSILGLVGTVNAMSAWMVWTLMKKYILVAEDI